MGKIVVEIVVLGIVVVGAVAVISFVLGATLARGEKEACEENVSYDAFLIQAENTSTTPATLVLPEGAKFNHAEGFQMDHTRLQEKGEYSFTLPQGEKGVITYWGPDKRTLDLGGQSENMRANVTRISSR